MSDDIFQSILLGDAEGAIKSVNQALANGDDPARILNGEMIAAMVEVGRLYEKQEYFVPEMMTSARAMKLSLAVLKPFLSSTAAKPVGRFAIGTVKGDLHDIGKNLVAMMLEGMGFEVLDLGTNVTPKQFTTAVASYKPHILGLSALLTTTMPSIELTIRALVGSGLRDGLIIMVGGAPVSQDFAAEVGADLFAEDAASAAKIARARLQAS